MAPLSFPRPSAALLATDTPGSVLRRSLGQARFVFAYSAFGHLAPGDRGLVMLGFNGQYRDPLSGNYLLGNGYRPYCPVLMRFLSADSLSPFSYGGINAYAYCKNDPVNQTDPSGAVSFRSAVLKVLEDIRLQRLKPKPVSASGTNGQMFELAESMPQRPRPIAQVAPVPRASLVSASTMTATTVSQTLHPLRTNSPAPMQATRQSPASSSRFETVSTESPGQMFLVSTPSHAPSHSRPRSSSVGSTDSWDQWDPNPVEVARQLNEAIAHAIRSAR